MRNASNTLFLTLTLLSLQEILHIAREKCQEQELLVNLPGAMPGMPLGKWLSKRWDPILTKPLAKCKVGLLFFTSARATHKTHASYSFLLLFLSSTRSFHLQQNLVAAASSSSPLAISILQHHRSVHSSSPSSFLH